ncbi:MAG: hypothetical protein FWD57_13545, partial [Polyangiaceae bacterium]|nr:hypothetical protein [Polyangiaceae bacterium]
MRNIDGFIARWTASGGREQPNSRVFLTELCDVFELPRPDSAGPVNEGNAYSFDREVCISSDNGSELRMLDLYKKGCFVLTSKRGRCRGSDPFDNPHRTASSVAERGTRIWEDSMLRARRQAAEYARCLPPREGRPPFLIVVDVGYCFDLYTDFSCTAMHYLHFPDPRRHRIMFDDLAKPKVRKLFRAIWNDPMSLDPSLLAAKVTEEVASRLATLSRMLEEDGRDPNVVWQFLVRCILSMFAEAVGLIPSGTITKILENSVKDATVCQPLLRDLWLAIDFGQASAALRGDFPQFGLTVFANSEVFRLRHEHLLILLSLATANWREVEPVILGTLLERALDPKERHKLGAHYTPRAYVERLIFPTIISPLRNEWECVQAQASDRYSAGSFAKACELIAAFLARLRKIRVLDPACGSGNFLYVAMEHMKLLECEIVQTLESYGETVPVLQQIGPQQFLGLEINPRAAQIAEMVLWIGHLQWRFGPHGLQNPQGPVLPKFGNIQQTDAVLEYSSSDFAVDKNGLPVRRWNGETHKTDPISGLRVPHSRAEVDDEVYKAVAAPKWPEADYIVGNPPFIGGKDKKQVLGPGYFNALAKTYPMLPESCDFVMYWWHKAAELVRAGKVKRFGFITTNSISQVFNRRVISLHMESENPLFLSYAIPDHPWIDAPDGAAVRIAMTVAEKGSKAGVLATLLEECGTDTRYIGVPLVERTGTIFSNLRQGADITALSSLAANAGLCSRGMQLHGSGFIVTPAQAEELGIGHRAGLEQNIRNYRNGRDLAAKPRGVMVIDLFGLSPEAVRERFPEVFEWVYTHVKPIRDQNRQESTRANWWLFGGMRTGLRAALVGLRRYISTIETAKHRFFVFLPTEVLPDNKLVNIASDDAYDLGVLSSRIHVSWASATGSRLGLGAVYVKTICFDAFPFPNPSTQQKQRIRELGEKLDAHRKSRQAQHPDLTLTNMYNVLEALRAGRTLRSREKTIHENAHITVLRQLHDELDDAVAEAYGWAPDIQDEDILTRLVELNAVR